MTQAVFLDRDGVINKKPPDGEWITKTSNFKLLPKVKKAIKLLKENGFRIFIVTNQRGVALGKMTMKDVEKIHKKMKKLLPEIDRVYFCPHMQGECTCRKPSTGMFRKAKKDFPEIRFKKSYLVSDSINDLYAGEKLGCFNILIASKNLKPKQLRIDYIARSLHDAIISYILPVCRGATGRPVCRTGRR